ncbi:hypothetical protein ElyMa_005460200 [Elysia marginata]|uniref:Uncharacterized protein n=1 Tax=Elysia marginata TaxID=1093978 RepID=A0AAV4EN72_9GAST|nr:hypothetical protein ElyMa_005460200 [Elysia marginata]
MSESGTQQVSTSILARKYRKKLRQIENLERLNRPLTEEECIKVNSKSSVREKLKDVLERLEKEPELPASAPCLVEEKHAETNSSDVQEHNFAANEITSRDDAGNISSECVLPNPTVTFTPTGGGDQFNESGTGSSEITKRALQKQEIKIKPKVNPAKEKKESKAVTNSAHVSKRLCRVTYLDGHSDIITSLVIVAGRVITASRDTTLKSWDLVTGEELQTFGGHTETVTCVLVVDAAQACLLEPGFSPDDELVVSSSYDCTLKVWSLNSGRLLKSVYTFNPLTKICFFPPVKQIITGSVSSSSSSSSSSSYVVVVVAAAAAVVVVT